MFGFNQLATKTLIGLGAVVLVLCLYVWGQRGYQKALQQANEVRAIATQRDAAIDDLRLVKSALTRDKEIADARIKEAERQEALAEKRFKDLQDALKDSPEWADAALPDSVYRALDEGAGNGGGAAAPAKRAAAAVPRAKAARANKPRTR